MGQAKKEGLHIEKPHNEGFSLYSHQSISIINILSYREKIATAMQVLMKLFIDFQINIFLVGTRRAVSLHSDLKMLLSGTLS